MERRERICPICKEKYTEYPAISRNKRGEICPTCGTAEAADAAGMLEDVMLKMAYVRNPKILNNMFNHIVNSEGLSEDSEIYALWKEIGFSDSEILHLCLNSDEDMLAKAKESEK